VQTVQSWICTRLLQNPSEQSYKEALQVQNIIRYHTKDAIEWLRKNSYIISKAYEYAEEEIKDSPERFEILDLAALLVLVRVYVRK